jgi:hypothetical protein
MSTVEQQDAPSVPISETYKWSAWLHVGPGADKCEAVNEEQGTNDCSNPLHFHAFCRLPNPFAHREIREEALAAKARRVRALRDPDSNAAVILEDELDRLAREGDLAKPAIVDELVGQDWWRDFLEATADVLEIEDPDGTKPFEHIKRDIAHYNQQIAELDLDEEGELPEELQQLRDHIERYNTLVDEKREALTAPRREALAAMDLNRLLDMVRDQRIDVDSNEAFAHEYATLQWFLCTLNRPGGEPVFKSQEAMKRADTDVIEGLRAVYVDLEKTKQRGGEPGNS